MAVFGDRMFKKVIKEQKRLSRCTLIQYDLTLSQEEETHTEERPTCMALVLDY
jgi:hypothetical protein